MKKIFGIILVALLLTGCMNTVIPVEKEEQKAVEEVKIAEIEIEEVKAPIGIKVKGKLTQSFVDRYKYEDSCGYFVALKINDLYYNVFRNENKGVSNDKKLGLTGAISMCELKKGAEWNIYFGDNKFARKDEYGYIIKEYTENDQLTATFSHSPVKETSGFVDFTLIYLYE